MYSVHAMDEWADWDAAERDAQWSAYEAEYRPEVEAEARERAEADEDGM